MEFNASSNKPIISYIRGIHRRELLNLGIINHILILKRNQWRTKLHDLVILVSLAVDSQNRKEGPTYSARSHFRDIIPWLAHER